jgi:hypothetical protein
MKEHDHLTTADLARAEEARAEDMRGHRDEPVVNRDDAAVVDATMAAKAPPAIPARPNQPPGTAEPVGTPGTGTGPAALFADEDATRFRSRWTDVQTGFVDEPRRAVEHADSLVAEVMKRLADVFAKERAALEHQWDRGDNVTTEDLRVTLQRYRLFFDRLLSV